MRAQRPESGLLPPAESYATIVAKLGGVLFVLMWVAVVGVRHPAREIVVPPAVKVELSRVEPTDPEPAKQPSPASGPQLDPAAVARAEAALEAARRDRLSAEGRVKESAAALAAASSTAASQAIAARSLASRVRDPSTRIRRASEQTARLRSERERLEGELAALAQTPKPKRKSLVDRTPVARPAEGKEFHFELRRNRVAFIDLEHLLERVVTDAKLRIRMNGDGQPISATVGPVGVFSLHYVLGRGIPGLDEMIEHRSSTYDLRSFEVVPEFEGRGETFEMAFQPASDFARTINRLNPLRATVTFWVYPDSFGLYRKLRDELHTRGFLVAARPMPEGLPIKGSPAGSLSAGQ
jgi:hypothetical protein